MEVTVNKMLQTVKLVAETASEKEEYFDEFILDFKPKIELVTGKVVPNCWFTLTELAPDEDYTEFGMLHMLTPSIGIAVQLGTAYADGFAAIYHDGRLDLLADYNRTGYC